MSPAEISGKQPISAKEPCEGAGKQLVFTAFTGRKPKKRLFFRLFLGSGGGIRTPDTRIMIQRVH
ncbi:MAG: hypothetical protein O2931_06290, partial [Planctomycetota bacterium]|nr:hypothetical protein [Planctomycetota bacterium]